MITKKVLVRPSDIKPSFKDWKILGAFNPGAVRYKDGKIVLYVRVAEKGIRMHGKAMHCPIIISGKEYKMGYVKIDMPKVLKKGRNVVYLKEGICRLMHISHFRKVVLSKDGFNVEEVDDKPSFTGRPPHENYGVEDPRITKIGSKYLMTYVSVSDNEGISTSLAVSKDLKRWQRKGIIFRETNKDVVLFPEKIKGKYAALHRPQGFYVFSRPSIWISYSPDLIYWGREKSIIRPRENSWESDKIGAGAPPIKTDKGWLLIYHGAVKKNKKRSYYAGAALLDLKDPEKIIARTPANKPLIEPSESYEKKGFVDNVVFPTGAVPDIDKENLLIYSGGADRVVSVKKISFKKIFKNMKYF
ncbi:glycoside hydrolase family 130 protein [Candidatus Woesearchaeota archaeon]|nr:glycoside hydrolase family 130 protein [Candidatus Woesearchaeota archaeon]